LAYTIDTRRLSLGLFLPIEAYQGPLATMQHHLERALQAEAAGFEALWLRDVPLHVPRFNDAGQLFDPFVYMGYLAAHTSRIALATGSAILTLRHPIHTAKAATSADALSGGRVALGVASGDRIEEFPAFGYDHDQRGELFRASFETMRRLLDDDFVEMEPTHYGHLQGAGDLLPKAAVGGRIPMYVTGYAGGQRLDWIARHADGWIFFPQEIAKVSRRMYEYRAALERQQQPRKPYLQSLYIDLLADPDAPAQPLHLGFRSGRHHLIDHLKRLEVLGVNHVMLVLRFSSRPIKTVLDELGREVLPHFSC